MKFCLCAVLLASAAMLASAIDFQEEYDSFPNYDDNFYDEDEKIEADLDKLNAASDIKVKADIDKFREDTQFADKEDDIDGIDDYQFEDNRDRKNIAADDDKDTVIDNDDEKRNKDAQADYALLWGDDNVAPLPVPEAESAEDKAILEETQKILDDDADAFEEEINKAIANAEPLSDNKPIDQIIEETKKILEETDDSFDVDEKKTGDEKVIDDTEKELKENNSLLQKDQQNIESVVEEEPKPEIIDDIPIVEAVEEVPIEKLVEEVEKQNASNIEHDVIVEEEDTVDKVYADLNSDLDKLFETLDKLSDDHSVSDEKLEEVYDKLDEHFLKDDDNNVEGSEELVDGVKPDADYSDVDFDKIIQDIINEDNMKVDDSHIDLNVLLNDELNEPNPDDAFERDVESLPDVNAEPILYLDAIVDEPKNAESVENINENGIAENASVEAKEIPDQSNKDSKEAKEFENVDINSLNSEEMEGLVKQFAIAHSDVLDVHSDTFDQNVAPIHIKLNVDNPEVVTSPNYPSPYPTNNIIDWVFDGEGMGIEMNITDFLVDGAIGDYLLVQPGGVDESGHDGLLFTYRLNSRKRFRFTDVDRLFVRFEARPGNWNTKRGFQFSVKMIAPLPEEPEPIPEPEPVLSPPHSLHTIYLASAIPQFNDLNETFRMLLADMAEKYILDNDIEPGLNTTAEVTQITAVSACPVTWPRYQLCAAVTFGVSLTYEEEEEAMLDADALDDMWSIYSTRDPFALRLRQMGIAEFQQPNSSVLTAWLVIASGVVISMVMLVFVLWRFSCFEDYTRMKTYSDTDSLQNEKRGLDLYPTPHQNLPPLYAENEYKWQDNEDSTRVDMGGFANKSYSRDMYDFDSDEEVVAARDRTGAVTARDIYNGSIA